MRAENKRRICAIVAAMIYASAVRHLEPRLVGLPFDPAWMTRGTAALILVVMFWLGDKLPDDSWDEVDFTFATLFFLMAFITGIALANIYGMIR